MGEKKEYHFRVNADAKPSEMTITLKDVCAEKVIVESWGHSGPVSVTIVDIPLIWLLDKILELGGVND